MSKYKVESQSRFARFRKSRIAVLTTALTAIALVAFATLLLVAPIRGDLQIVDPDLQWVAGTEVVRTSGYAGNNDPVPGDPEQCSVSIDDGELTVNISNVISGDGGACVIQADVKATGGGEPTRVQDIDVFDITEDAYVNMATQNGEDSVQQACGATVTDSGLTVAFEVIVPDGLDTGLYPATATAGLHTTDEFLSSDCPKV